MTGTLKWCLLVTLAVILTDVVGPNNQVFEPKETSTVWVRKELGENLYNTMARQLRSKFDDMASPLPRATRSKYADDAHGSAEELDGYAYDSDGSPHPPKRLKMNQSDGVLQELSGNVPRELVQTFVTSMEAKLYKVTLPGALDSSSDIS
ncbi:MAG: LOW QUALITY PROTEIN: hypothetical protein J3Q66DRAFT_366060 [Benniella sp.]|nr:MAG: LOW QUALITY PROTEIN: hypothetical protein J3Q66DRAFT_366060 [Benniella sp.]